MLLVHLAAEWSLCVQQHFAHSCWQAQTSTAPSWFVTISRLQMQHLIVNPAAFTGPIIGALTSCACPPFTLLQMQHLIVNPAMLEASKDREREADAKLTSKQQQLASSTCVVARRMVIGMRVTLIGIHDS